ncbi:hypothetical protein A2841_03860 [Candidatus Kaiserbacteria bacterium RIFCSPHIGHO2_01_FULL_48_10]|uniref:Glycosyl transferase family 1 domain-containing protein n=1 Tax=Candidatus Kaiserbacteria bacterium RIFCSPHIGHO2_01_FULL_48_10 TaxID=1798476 RepID=A0A1F6C218_9BACT|nr:MAG: hypothetical protein A2841_03860 [Candidatus Kaiserbacteria bacterium RIFCSPHIGHO2_01_FULL_48_10]HLC99907.1 glycosyltransferase family 4 protein [Patescibacteria group bacterium]
MRKSLLVTLEYPPHVGGVSVYYDHIVKQFPFGSIAVLTVDEEGRGRRVGDSATVYRRKLISKSRFFWPKWLPMMKHIRDIVQKERIGLIHAGQVLPIGTAAFILNRLFKIPYIVYCHGMDIMLASSHPRKKRLVRQILARAKFVVANSEFTKKEIIKYGVREQNILTLYPCPNLHIAREVTSDELAELRQQYHLEKKFILLTTGRLVERKGHDVVLGVLAKIKEKIPNIHYIIVGDGPRRNEIETMVEMLKLQNDVTLVGEASEHDLAAWYAVSDVFVMLSRQVGIGDVEGFGIVYLEANMFGKPVIAGRSGGTEDAVIDGETGLLVDPTNTDEIQSAIAELLLDSEKAKTMGEKGRQRVNEVFQWSKQVEPLLERLEKI